jgi:hypothetical protein
MGFYWSNFNMNIKEKIVMNMVQLCNKLEKKYSKKIDFTESIWKNKKKDNDKDNVYCDDIDHSNDITDYTLLLKSLSAIKFNFQNEILLSINNSNNHIKDLKFLKDLVLTMFVRLSEHEDISFESQDFAVCVRSLGRGFVYL